MAAQHLFEDRDRAKPRRGFQQRNDLCIEEISQRVRPAAGSYCLGGRWRPMALFEAIGRRRADRCLGGRDRRAVCLSERHVEPHLVIGDVAAGQRRIPSSGDSVHVGRSRSRDDGAPERGEPTVVAGLTPAVGLRPPYGVRPATTFSSRLSGVLTLIVAEQPWRHTGSRRTPRPWRLRTSPGAHGAAPGRGRGCRPDPCG